MTPSNTGAYGANLAPLSSLNGSQKPETKNVLNPAIHRDIFLTAHRKAERLSAAVYLVTSFFSDNEPIRWKMRATALDVLENISALRGGTHYEREFAVQGALRGIADTLSLAEIAAMSGMISEMNYRVLKAEYGALRHDIHERDNIHTPEHFEIPKDFFTEGITVGPNTPRAHTPAPVVTSETPTHQGQDKGHMNVLNTDMSDRAPHARVGAGKNMATYASAPVSLRTEKTGGTQGGEKRSNGDQLKPDTKAIVKRPAGNTGRRATVLGLFGKSGSALTVKDVAKALSGVSEKTAQRELAALVDEGVLKRTGERRWSVYSRA